MAIAFMAMQSSGDTWPHLIENVLPDAVRRTLILMTGVAAIALIAFIGGLFGVESPGSRPGPMIRP